MIDQALRPQFLKDYAGQPKIAELWIAYLQKRDQLTKEERNEFLHTIKLMNTVIYIIHPELAPEGI